MTANPTAPELLAEISRDAQKLCGTYFLLGDKSTVVSHEPHQTLTPYSDALVELIDAGIITSRPYNSAGSVEYKGTSKSAKLGRDWNLKHSPFFAALSNGGGDG